MPESTQEIKEIEPRLRVLIIDMQPGLKQNIRISQELFGEDKESIEKFSNLAVTSVKTPKSEVESKFQEREKKTELYLPSVDDFSAIVVTGSPFAVYPREEEGRLFLASWKKELFNFIRTANEHGIPFLGICFGGQALAEAMGGKTVQMRGKQGEVVTERGWAAIRKSPDASNDPIMKNLPDEFVAPENHEDVVARLPEGAALLAENEYGVQGFRIGSSWGFEFHPERKPERVEKVLTDQKIVEEMEKQGKSLEAVKKLGESYDVNLRKVFSNFLKFAWRNRQ